VITISLAQKPQMSCRNTAQRQWQLLSTYKWYTR